MSPLHLLRVEEGPERVASLIDAARAEDLRIGWLDLAATAAPVPGDLEEAASRGVLRAVSVGAGRSIAVKPLKGAPVLKDLLREHFRGCALVLVRGEIDAPLLRPDGDAWRIEVSGEAARAISTPQLAAALRQSRPWGSPAAPAPEPLPPPKTRRQRRERERLERKGKKKERKKEKKKKQPRAPKQ